MFVYYCYALNGPFNLENKLIIIIIQGRIQEMLRRAEGGAKFFGVFGVKNHDFTPKNHIFSKFRGGAAPPWIRPCYYTVTRDIQKGRGP